MNFSCDNCQRRYTIADEKVRGKTVKIRCKNCQSIISVVGPSDEPDPLAIPEEDRTRMVPLEQIEKIRTASLSEMPVATPPKSPWEEEPTRTAPPLDTSAQWFAMVKGKQVGPLDATALIQRSASGEVNPRTYMWKQGMADWKRAADIPELATVLAGAQQPPPPPPPGAMPKAAPRSAWQPQAAPELDEEQPTRQSTPDEEQFAASGRDEDTEGTRTEPGPSELDSSEDDVPETEPTSPRPAAASEASAAFLFSDLDLANHPPDVTNEPTAVQDRPGVARPRDGKDPFAALGKIDPASVPPPSESTNYFIAKSGVKNRNPAWKIATFIVLLIALPVGILYLLSELQVVPLQVTRVNEQGQEVKESVFSSEGVSELRDLLLGRKRKVPVKADPDHATRPASREPKQDKPAGTDKPKTPGGPSNQELADLYKGDGKTDVGPQARPSDEHPAVSSSAKEGPGHEELAKVVEQNQKAFQGCIEAEMKKNPAFKGGKVLMVTTVGSSGVVKKVSIDRREIDTSPLGECLKMRAKHMTFSAFSGDDVEVQIPLVLTSAM